MKTSHIITTGSIGLFGLTMLSGVILSSNTTSADTEVIDQVRLTVPIACTMSGTGTTHTATLNPGTYSGASGNEYENGIGKTTLTAICNDDNGLSIYAIGYTGNSYDSENHTKLVGSTTGGAIATKAYASGDTTSNWSMKLTKITDSAESYNPQNLTIQSDTEGTFSNWHSVPDTYTKVAEYHANTGSSTTDTTLGVKLETTYAAYISSSQPADTYIGQVKYTLVHPYDHAEPDEFTSETLQSVADWGSKVAPGQTVTVTDVRDGQEYTVVRLADGKLWMTKNLRLDIGRANITAENTNNPTQAFLTAASNASSSDEWCTDDNSTCTDQIKYNTSNINNPTTDSEGHKYDEYGVYYNWYTATAGNGTYDTASNTNVSGDICPSGWHLPTGTITSGAPSSWTGEFWNLATALGGGIEPDNSNYSDIVGSNGSARMRNNPNNFLYSGHMVGNVISSRGTSGEYFTATKNGSERAYLTTIGSSSIVPGYNNALIYFGKTIRCIANAQTYSITVNYGEHVASVSIDGNIVADGDIFDFTEGTSHSVDATFEPGYMMDRWFITNGAFTDAETAASNFVMGYQSGTLTLSSAQIRYLQDVAEWGNVIEVGQTTQAVDSRDNAIYRVKRLENGKLWMIHNLDLGRTPITVDLNSTNTHITNNSIITAETFNAWLANQNITGSYSIPIITPITSSNSSNGRDADILGNHYGTLYNFAAASANTIIVEYDNTQNATSDLCPKDWRLPTGGSDGDIASLMLNYDGLVTQMNSNTDPTGKEIYSLLQKDFHLPLAGRAYGGARTIHGQGERGAYWSSTYRDGINMKILEIYPDLIDLQPALTRNYDLSIRCLTDF